MSVPHLQVLTTAALIFAASPAWLDFCSPVESIAPKLTMTLPGVNLQKANCITGAKAEILSWDGLLSIPYILKS